MVTSRLEGGHPADEVRLGSGGIEIPDRGVKIVVHLDKQAHLPTHARLGCTIDKRNFCEDETRQVPVLGLAIDIRVLPHRLDELEVEADFSHTLR